MAASAMATFSSASKRAFSERVKWRSFASDTATEFHSEFADVESQNRLKSVCSALRAALVALPIVFTSSKSAVYRALVSDGGPPGRNCEGEAITHGVRKANCGTAPGMKAGGVGRHSPMPSPPTNGGGVAA